MTPRLYRTTLPLAVRVALALRHLGIAGGVGSPTTIALISLYVAGLILLDGPQTQTRVALFLPGRAHDALNRLLRVMPLSAITLGVDTHVALALDGVGRHRGTLSVPADPAGYENLVEWASGFGPLRHAGVEGTGW